MVENFKAENVYTNTKQNLILSVVGLILMQVLFINNNLGKASEMKKVLSILTILYMLFVSAIETHAVEQISIQLRWHHGFQFAGYYMAQEKGFYEKAGLEVTFLEGGVGINGFDAVIDGKAQLGVAGSELAIEVMKGRPLKSVAVIFQHSPYELMVRASSGYTNPQQLTGKQIYMARIPRTAEIQAMFVQEGVSLDQLILVDPRNTPRPFDRSDIDAYSVYMTNEPFIAAAKGMKTQLIRPINYGIDFYGDCLFSASAYIGSHSDAVESFKEASLKGWAYAFEHPEETISIIEDHYNTDNRSRDHLSFEYREMRKLVLPDLVPLGQQNPLRWNRIARIYADLSMGGANTDISSMVYDREKLKKAMGERNRRLLSLLLMGTLLVAGALYIWNLTLKKRVAEKTSSLNEEMMARQKSIRDRQTALKKYQILFNAFPLGITVSDQEGKIQETNAAAQEILGIDKQEHESRALKGREWHIVRPDGSDLSGDKYASVIALKERRQVSNQEMGIVKPNGTTTWISVTAAPLPMEQGGVVVTYNDITEKRAAEKERERLSHDLSMIFKNIPSYIYFKDKDNYILRVSDSVARLIGKTPEEMQGRHSSEFYPDLAEQYWQDDLEVIRSGMPKTGIIEPLKRPGDETRWLLTDKFPYRDESGAIAGVVVLASDVTQRMEADRQIKESEERLKLALEGANDGLWDWNMETDEVFYSPRWKEMVGYKDHEIQNHFSEWERLILSEDREKAWHVLNEYLAGKRSQFECEFRMRHKDGSLVHILSRAFAIRRESDQQPVRVIGTHVDITERKAMEKQLQQSQKMESIGTLAGGIAHDFNNILSAIIGYAELGIDDELTSSGVKDYLREILQAGHRAKDLVKQILAFARQSDEKDRPVKMAGVADEVIRFIRSTIPTTIDIRQEIHSSALVMGAPTQFTRC